MYCNFKPNNVLLNEDEPSQLMDLGEVADAYETTLGKHPEMILLFTQQFNKAKATSVNTDPVDEENKDESLSRLKPKRELSILGTFGFNGSLFMCFQTKI